MKNYESWHLLKSNLESIDFNIMDKNGKIINSKPMFRERDIWWCSIGENL